MMTLGRGSVQSISKKQRFNTRSSTTAELVGADDASVLLLCAKLFLGEQGYKVKTTSFSRTIRVQSCYRRMVRRVLGPALEL
jgi:hypothetical protein